MGVTLDKKQLQSALERAVRLADRGENLPSEWTERTAHIGESPSKTYVAVLASALLARTAYGERVDPRSIKARSGPRGFSARGSIAVLARNARDLGYDLGVPGPEPLNNQPWFHADRVDQIRSEEVRHDARDYLRSIKAYLKAIDSMSATEAEAALAAFIVSRRRVADDKREAAKRELSASRASLADLGDALQSFIAEDPEGGRRGQALVAAVLDCIFPRVELGAINDPDAFDVVAFRSKDDDVPSPVVQVKQKTVGEDTAILLAEMAATEGAPAALLAALDAAQPALDEQAIAAQTAHLGVIVATATSVPELFRKVAVFSAPRPREIATELPARYARRLREIEVKAASVGQLEELLDDLAE
jgi:SacI restriction endonuclease